MIKNGYKIYFLFITVILFLSISLYILGNYKLLSGLILVSLSIILLFGIVKFLNNEKNKKDIKTNIQKLYLEVFENNISVAKIDKTFKIIYANRSFFQLILCNKSELLKKDFSDILLNKTVYNEIIETIKYGQSWEGILFLITCSGAKVYVDCSIIPILEENKEILEYVMIVHDLTELMLSKKIIRKNLYIDSYTKLPNRLKLIEDKKEILSNDKTLILFNIDSFQAINSLYGNSFGDKVLKIVADWLEKNLPTEYSKLYKFEADVYAILITESFEKRRLAEYLNTISKKISKDIITCMGVDITISFTIGAIQGEKDLLKLVFIAYKEAKKAKKPFIIYDKDSNKEEEYIKNINMSNIIKESLKEDKIIPYFQPIINLRTNDIEKYETLMRIQKNENEIYLPSQFLDIAKHSRLYPALSRSVIEKAFETFKFSASEFSVNLSFLDIINQETMNFIFDLLNRYDLGSWVIFELLESEGIDNYDRVYKFVEIAKSYGAKIAIDDFGSGYSNFERLVELQIDYIKIDGSLIKNIDKNEDMKVITQTIIDFAQKLNIKTVAEYVHSKKILDTIRYMGVDFAQGFYIGEPSKTPIIKSKHLVD